MTNPIVTHTAGKVFVHYPPGLFDQALTALARSVHDDGEAGQAMTALMHLGEADLILGMPAADREEFGVYDVHDQAMAAAEALDALRDFTGEPGQAMTTAECRQLITLLTAHVARAEADARNGRSAA